MHVGMRYSGSHGSELKFEETDWKDTVPILDTVLVFLPAVRGHLQSLL